MNNNRLVKRVIFGVLPRKKEIGGPKATTYYTWLQYVRDVLERAKIITQIKNDKNGKGKGTYMVTYFKHIDINGNVVKEPKVVTEPWYKVAENKYAWDNIIEMKLTWNLRYNRLSEWLLKEGEPQYLDHINKPELQYILEEHLGFNGKQKLAELKLKKLRQNIKCIVARLEREEVIIAK
jgi:hypothetical protein